MKVEAVNVLLETLPDRMMTTTAKNNLKRALANEVEKLAVIGVKKRKVNVSSSDKSIEDCGTSTSIIDIQNIIRDRFNGDMKKFLTFLSDKIVTPDDAAYILKSANDKSKKGSQQVKQCVKNMYSDLFKMSPEDVINIQENFSSVRLMNEMRKKLPGIIPTRRQEMKIKSEMSKAFMAVMLPKRISTGWTIDAARLLEVLQFKYSFLEGTINVKLQGDGRLVGGRHSTYIGLNILNNELKLRGISYQNPKEIYPVSVFYESDSRDNLEKNIGEQHSLNKMISTVPPSVKFFLGGDEMFLESILSGPGTLGPTTNTGWNIYYECDKEQKRQVATNGLRTDLAVPISREHTESLLPEIPIDQTMFCILHGLARIVEKLVMLEVEGIMSTANKSSQTNCGMSADELVHNLECNINLRGVRQGNFHVPFDKSGKPEKISLNKDHALAIISPPPHGKENEFPHVLCNVVPKTTMANTLPVGLKQYLKLENDFTEFVCVQLIWDSVYQMFRILQKEPVHVLREEAVEGSLKSDDYNFSYSCEQLDSYKFHAERLYQLFCLRYTYRNLTPYIIKFIDYGRHFMTNLDVPVCRFSTEGGEHSNYDHNCFYYQHTTRNGGRDSNHDPNFAILLSSWRNLFYDITNGDVDVASAFQTYVQKHVWTSMVQRSVRKYLFKVTCRKVGLDWVPTTTHDSDNTKEKLLELEAIVSQRMQVSTAEKGLLVGKAFILSGNVPKYKGRKMTHQCVTELIKEHRGNVRKTAPGSSKGRSTKQYILLVNMPIGAKVSKPNKLVAAAIRQGYQVLDYKFLYDSVDSIHLQDCSQYIPAALETYARGVNMMPSLYRKHFKRRTRMITLLKERRKKTKLKNVRVKVPKSLAVYYAIVKRREYLKKTKLSFINSAKLFGKFAKDSKKLSPFERTRYLEMWLELKHQKRVQEERSADLVAHNLVEKPNYCTVLESMNTEH